MAHGTSATRNDISRIFKLPLQVNFNGDNLKSPHQELLDLGWELYKKLHGARCYRKGDYFIYINTKEKRYKIDSSYCEDVPNINLQLAKVLVRYLEELEC